MDENQEEDGFGELKNLRVLYFGIYYGVTEVVKYEVY